MLDHLPQELLSLIALYLDRGDLYRLVITSRQLCTAFQHCLYKDVRLRIETNNRQVISAFLYAVTRSPQLASYVHSLNIRCWIVPTTYLNEYSKKFAFDTVLVQRLLEERKGYSEKERSKWLKDLEKDDIDAWIALLIPQLRELRKLTFSWPYGHWHLYGMLENMHLEDQPMLPHLREVYVSSSGVVNGVQSNYLNAFFKLPSVRKIGCFAVSESEPWVFDETEPGPTEEDYLHERCLQPRSCNITDIDLESSDAMWGMRDWIRACRQLRSFKITQGGVVLSTRDPTMSLLEFQRIYRSLLLHQSSMECVWVDVSLSRTPIGFMGSFIDFPMLRFLHAPLSMLIEFDEQGIPGQKLQDVLPHSLETLRVFEGHQRALAGIELLAELAASQKTPELRAIYFDCPDQGRAGTAVLQAIQAAITRLSGICHETGVSFFEDRSLTRTDQMGPPTAGEQEMSPGVTWPLNEAFDVVFF